MYMRYCWLLFVPVLSAGSMQAAPVDFTKDIQPLLAKNCTQCHGAAKQKAGLRLETGPQVLKGSLNGPVVIAKKPGESRLVLALHGKGDAGQMPPKSPLADDEIKLITRWIEEGAIVPANDTAAKHWAFEPPRQAPVPSGVHPIDHFLNLERTKQGLVVAPAADRATLLRRLVLDLTGLPPTPAELDSFLGDNSPEAYERRLGAFLDSPQYGERWGRHFLDIWRYSDWYGYQQELRNSQKHIWNWRDWTVEAFNTDKPYDAMIREMLAGDETAPLDLTTLRATGFLARNYYKFNRNVWLDDIVEHTGKAFLGITLNCCRCHDHMYDPFTQEEYYRFRAIFEPHQVRLDPVNTETDAEKNGVPRVYDADLKAATFLFTRGDEKNPVKEKPLPPGVPACLAGSYSPKEVKWNAEIVHPTLRPAIRDGLLLKARQEYDAAKKSEARSHAALMNLQAVKAKLKADQARYATPVSPTAMELIRHAVALHLETVALTAEADVTDAVVALQTLEAAEKKNTKAIDVQKKKLTASQAAAETARKAMEKPPADYPPLTPTLPEATTGRRLALANWITSKENPLTARVLVNHVWLRHFGQPLVPTMFDFGKNGRPPTHQALLDWLAVEFMKSNWDVKKLHRLMMTSQAYRMQSSFANEQNRRLDPDNLLLARMNPRPLEAEAIRDSLLFVSGMLDPAMGGPELVDVSDASLQRRSLYYRHAPEKMMPFLSAFDNANTAECYRRATTVVPQQAMALVNSKLSTKAAEAVANALPKHDLVRAAYRKVLGREPTATEVMLCEEYLAKNPLALLVQALFNHADFSTIR
ncbi:DUF1553 domain-containing protein [soil metagenome]